MKRWRETSDTGSQVGAGSFMKVVQWRMKPKPVWLSCIKLPDPSTMWSYWSMCPLIPTAWVAFHLEWATCAAQPSSDKHPGGSLSASRLKWIFTVEGRKANNHEQFKNTDDDRIFSELDKWVQLLKIRADKQTNKKSNVWQKTKSYKKIKVYFKFIYPVLAAM